MSKKFGKILLFTAAIGSAVAATYYYLQKRDADLSYEGEDDFDNFEAEATEASRNYVELPKEASAQAAEGTSSESSSFTPLKDVANDAEATSPVEEVEEFFDEEDEETEAESSTEES